MSELFDSLGASDLLRDLHAITTVLENIDVSCDGAGVTSLVEQVSDLVDICQSFDRLATQERRHPSVHLQIRSPIALLHLRTVLDSTAAIIYECLPFARLLQSSLKAFDREVETTRHTGIDHHLEDQAWYGETFEALRLFKEVLRALYTAIELLQYQDDSNEDVQCSKARTLRQTSCTTSWAWWSKGYMVTISIAQLKYDHFPCLTLQITNHSLSFERLSEQSRR